MKKAIIVLLLSFIVTGCSAVTDNPPKPMQVDTPSNAVPDVTVNAPEPEKIEEEPEVPIYIDDLPLIISFLEPNSLGTVYLEATYKNNTEYPIVSYSMDILLKDKNEKTYLSNYDTVLPGETSPNFDSFGPDSGNIDDIEKLTLSVTALTEGNKKLYIDYDLKLGWAEWWYEE